MATRIFKLAASIIGLTTEQKYEAALKFRILLESAIAFSKIAACSNLSAFVSPPFFWPVAPEIPFIRCHHRKLLRERTSSTLFRHPPHHPRQFDPPFPGPPRRR